MADNELAAAIAARSGVDVALIVAAMEDVAASVPSHTVQMEPFTDTTAVRTVRLDRGEIGWWVIDHSDGSCVWDPGNPDKGWPAVFTPETPTAPLV